jgi:DNA ligase 1
VKPRLMHGCDWTGQDVSGWWVSEKLDGWRAYWTGSEFISRQGNTLNAPDWFTADMPSQPLDGELWAGPGTTHNAVASLVLSGRWRRLTYRPFDIPSLGVKVEAAMAILASLPLPLYCRPVEYHRTQSTEAAIAEMWATVADGGEGLMLRKPGAGYAPDYRTEKLLKLKPDCVGSHRLAVAAGPAILSPSCG